MKSRVRLYLSPSPKKGTVIIVALWAVVILAIIGLAISSLVSPQLKLAQSVTERSSTIAAVNAVIRFVLAERKEDQNPEVNPDFSYDSLFELSRKRELDFGNIQANYQLTDEDRKININTASKEVLRRLPGLSDAGLVDNIISYRDNKAFSLREELLLVEGINQDMLQQFEDLVTVFGDGRININTASELILTALGLSDDLITLTIRYRKGYDNEQATEDDNVFKETTTIVSDLDKFFSLSDEQKAKFQAFVDQNIFSTKSPVYLLELETSFLNKLAYKFKIIFDIQNSKVLLWQESI